MVQRLITLVSKVTWILKNELVTGHLAQVQLKYSRSRQVLSKSSASFSYKPPKTSDKPTHPSRGNNGSSAKTEGKATTEKKNIDKRTNNNTSATSPPKYVPKAPKQGSKFGGRRWSKEMNSFRHEEYEVNVEFSIAFVLSTCAIIIMCWQRSRKKSYEEITWEDFAENYLARNRVAKTEVIKNTWLQFQPAPGPTADGAETLIVRIDSLDKNELIALMAKLLEIATKERQEVTEDDLPITNQKLVFHRIARFFSDFWP